MYENPLALGPCKLNDLVGTGPRNDSMRKTMFQFSSQIEINISAFSF